MVVFNKNNYYYINIINLNKKIMKKILSVLLSAAFLLTPFVFATPASAAAFNIGNDSASRSIVDTYTNFTIIDTNNPATANGEVTSFDYYASNTNAFRFVIVNSGNKVTWVSDPIIPASVGSHSFILATPAVVQAGDNVGMYFASSGTIPFDYVGAPAAYTPNNNGLPVVGATLSIEGTSGRTYSLVAHADTVNCSSMTLMSSTSTQFKHLTDINPGSSSADGSFTLGTPGAAVLTGPDGFPGAWDTAGNDPDLSGAIWVNNNSVAPSTPAGTGAGQNGNQDIWRLFSHSFTIPAGATISSAMLHLSADNSVEAFLDNSSVGTSPNFTTVSDIPLTVTPGTHELEFVTKNDAYDGPTNPTAVIYKAVINYCAPAVELDCPAAPSIAAKYLQSKGVKSGSTTAKNIVSQVAHEMGLQKNFQGTGACDNPTYSNKIKAFVDSKLS